MTLHKVTGFFKTSQYEGIIFKDGLLEYCTNGVLVWPMSVKEEKIRRVNHINLRKFLKFWDKHHPEERFIFPKHRRKTIWENKV